MKRVQPLTATVCLFGLVAAGGLGVAVAAERAVATHDLKSVLASDQVKSARWTRQTDAYVLLVVLAPSARPAHDNRTTGDPAAATQAEYRPRLIRPPPAEGAEIDRGSFFIANNIANLRGLDPAFCGRTLTLVDGRRSPSGERPAAQPPPSRGRSDQPYEIAVRDPRVEVWLLRADGTHILPVAYRCGPVPVGADATERVFEISYTYPAAEGEHAVAVAIRVREDYFIEKLQPLPSPAATE